MDALPAAADTHHTSTEQASTAVPAHIAALTDSSEHEDAYARHFKLVLRAVVVDRPDLAKLFSAQELALASAFLHELTPVEQQLYARLFQRKGPWFKTTALFRYFVQKPYVVATTDDVDEIAGGGEAIASTGTIDNNNISNGDDGNDTAEPPAMDTAPELPDNVVVQTALQSLIRHTFFATLSLGTSTVASMSSCSPSSSPAATRTLTHSEAGLLQALDALQHCAAAPELAALQKILTGSRSAKKKVSPSSSNTHSATSATPWSSKAEAFQAIKKVVMTQRRIDGSRIPLAALAHQVWLETYPLSGKCKRDVLVVQLADTPRDLFHRMHRLFYFQASLPFNSGSLAAASASAGKCERDALATAVARLHQDATQWPGLMVVFKRVVYPTYVIRIDHHVFESSVAYVCYEVASRLHAVMRSLDQLLSIDAPDTQEPDLDVKWIAFESTPQLLAFQKLVETDDDGFELLTDTNTDAGTSDGDWQIESWRQLRSQLRAMASLDDFVLESRRCFHAFTLWAKARTSGSTAMTVAPPAFFAKCSAGYHLARVLHHAVALYEKQRQYQVAVLLLNDLLDAPFLQRKRGHWWERLALNLEHLKCVEQAHIACANALSDVYVVGADRLALSRRMRRLQKRVASDAAGVQPPPPPQQQAPPRRSVADRDRDDFVSLLSDDDDDDNTSTLTQSGDNPVAVLPDGEYAYPKEYIVGRPLNRQTAEKSRFIGYDDEPCSVEQLVLQYYKSQRRASAHSESRGGWYGVHCEGHVIGNIFGLCTWDVLYASVPNVFQTPFQSAPLDFGDADAFVAARRDAINTMLRAVRDEQSIVQVLDAMASTWRREFGKVSRFVSWPNDRYLPLAFHQLVVLAMGTARLAKLLQYMLTSPEYHRAQNGLPDLLMLRASRSATVQSQVNDHELPVDEHGCLDLYAFCRMTHQLNLNDRAPEDAAADDSRDPQQQSPPSSAQSLVDRLDGWCLELKLVEVKGPRDRLSDKQTLWLQVLNDDVGLDASVTHVVEDTKTLEKMRQPALRKKQKAAPRSQTDGLSASAAKKKAKSDAKPRVKRQRQ